VGRRRDGRSYVTMFPQAELGMLAIGGESSGRRSGDHRWVQPRCGFSGISRYARAVTYAGAGLCGKAFAEKVGSSWLCRCQRCPGIKGHATAHASSPGAAKKEKQRRGSRTLVARRLAGVSASLGRSPVMAPRTSASYNSDRHAWRVALRHRHLFRADQYAAANLTGLRVQRSPVLARASAATGRGLVLGCSFDAGYEIAQARCSAPLRC